VITSALASARIVWHFERDIAHAEAMFAFA